MMKVLIANKFFFRNGGSETVMFQEREFLRSSGVGVIDFSMNDRRNQPSPYAMSFLSAREYSDASPPWQRITSAAAMLHSREAARKVVALIDAEQPDLLHCHNIYHQLTPSIILAAKGRGLPVVLTLHDFKLVCPTYNRLRHGEPCTECSTGNFFNVVRYRCSDGSLARSSLLYAEARLQRWLGSYEHVDRFIAPSRYMASAVTQWRVPAHRVEVLPNGVDVRGTDVSGIDDGYFLYIGRLSPEKGLETLGAAHAGSGLRCVVAGTGPMERDLKERFQELEVIGHQSGEALKTLIARSGAIVLPSVCYENCPMSILEAMAHGKPVIASRIGGVPELVKEGETGLLFAPGDATGLRRCMQKLAAAREMRSTMGVRAREAAESMFSLERHNRRVLETYRAVTGRTH